MDKINYRFLNYKHHASFENALQNDRISNDSIVFIQDTSSIWARGKEYVCSGGDYATVLQFISDANNGALYFAIPYSTMGEDGTLEFRDGDDRPKFYIHMQNGTITLQDADRNSISATYILSKDFNTFQLSLSPVSFSGSYNDLTNKPTIPTITIDSKLNSNSINPVQNSVITTELQNKANSGDVSNIQDDIDDIEEILEGKQDILTAGRGISIEGTTISSTLDTDVYEIITELGSTSGKNPNKIYILEQQVDNNYTYTQYRIKSGQWVQVGSATPTVDLSDYLTKNSALLLYQPKANDYVRTGDLSSYASAQSVTDLELAMAMLPTKKWIGDNYLPIIPDLGDYAKQAWVELNFVKRDDVYHPKEQDFDYGDIDNPQIPYTPSNPSSGSITVDDELSLSSPNPVKNSVLTPYILDRPTKKYVSDNYATLEDLSAKANKSDLSGYVKSSDFQTGLSRKLDVLTAGEGISIIDNEISLDAEIDTDVYEIVSSLPVFNIKENKIYILEEEDNGSYTYTQHKWDATNERWITIGSMSPSINLSNYLTRDDAGRSFAPKASLDNPYIHLSEIDQLRRDLALLYQPIGSYLTLNQADLLYQPKGTYLTALDLQPYLTSKQIATNYASKGDLEDLKELVVQWVQVYTDGEGGSETPEQGGSTPGTTGGGSSSGTTTITVDDALSLYSGNPVKNRVIKLALDQKADKSTLNSYATKSDLNDKADKTQLNGYVEVSTFNTAIAGKQDKLTAGHGIAIDADTKEISVTLDTKPFVIVSELPVFNIDEDKIYIVETEDNGLYTYTEYRRKNNTWVEVGEKDFSVDLSGYYTKSESDTRYLIPQGTYLTPAEAQQTYLPKGNDYALASEVARDYQLKGDYVDSTALEALRMYADNTFKEKGDYVLAGDVALALITLQLIIDQKYVLKKDVYNPENTEFSTSDPTQISLSPSGNGGCSCHMITCTTEEYEALVANNMVNENAYYFTYEAEVPTDWHFGDNFPIVLTDNWAFGGTFPITLR